MQQILELEEHLGLIVQQILKALGRHGLVVSHLEHIGGDSHAVVAIIRVVAVSQVDDIVEGGRSFRRSIDIDDDISRSVGRDLIKADIDQVAGHIHGTRAQSRVHAYIRQFDLIGQLVRNNNLWGGCGSTIGYSDHIGEGLSWIYL